MDFALVTFSSKRARKDLIAQSGPPRMSRSLPLVDVVSSLSDNVQAHSITRV
jgi:hypothetical protein